MMYSDATKEFNDEPLPIRLIPVTSLSTSRYDGNSACIELYSRVINRGPPSQSSTSSLTHSHWRRCIHPEGQPYFMQDTEFGFAAVHKELICNGINVPPKCELFLELGDDHMSCSYYFVDHVEKALFWLEDICTESLGIPAAMSASHLEIALQRLYWVHVEFFPMHHESHEQEVSSIVEKIYNIISHGQADRLTSRTSTFPYTADTCTHFLKLLGKRRGGVTSLAYEHRYLTLMSITVNQRFLTFYGQKSAQLDRLQEMCPSGAVQEHKWLSTIADWLMWGIPHHYNNLLEDLYVNEQVYVDQWTSFIPYASPIGRTVYHGYAGAFSSWLTASILLANVRGGTLFMSIPSGLSCAVSIASGSCLHLRHQPLVESTATVGARYLRFAKSGTIGFVPSSIAFSLPRATYVWGIGFLTAQFLFVVSHNINRVVGLAAASVVAVILTFVICVTNPEEDNTSDFASFCRSLATCCLPRLYAISEMESDASGDVLTV
ncbi:hypothetical protein JVU11DRAFT_5724 [Chiua virens]|nr:hypothetical protein JVU11DRAFT_5724 [Chiua virens]